MNDDLKQYRINSKWRNHVLKFIVAKNAASKQISRNTKDGTITTIKYCQGDVEYARALDIWLEFMEEEERFAFYHHFAMESIDDARKSLSLLMSRKDSDPDLRMPLLRDAITSYSRPFKNSHGRLTKRYRLTETVGVPSPEELHRKILSARDQLYAHCDLSVKAPRVSIFGISLRVAGQCWSDYEPLLPSMVTLMDNANHLIRQYIIQEGMDDSTRFFQRFEDTESLTASEPVLLNQIYGN